MLQSELFTKTLKEAPREEQSKNAQFLIRGGFIDKLMAGVYSFLPLGKRVLHNIESIIREEMVAIGGQEVLMPALHPIENYEATGREGIDVLFHLETNSGQKIVLGQSHEEIVVPLIKKYIDSYRDLPLAVFQIQTKFRNELRAKSGIFRGREFIMKDLYSFHANEEDFQRYYKKAALAYRKILERVGISDQTFYTRASGGTFSKYSDEFQTVTDAGEDTIFICHNCNIAINDEIINDLNKQCPECKKSDLEKKKSIEVGNIFPLKTRYSDAFSLTYKNNEGTATPIIMGCYGLGLTRLMGAIAEIHADERGIVWPHAVAPFSIHLISLDKNKEAQTIYDTLISRGVSVLFDDREDKTAGEKFADADLIGTPLRVVISKKTCKDNKIEIKKRGESKTELIDSSTFLKNYE